MNKQEQLKQALELRLKQTLEMDEQMNIPDAELLQENCPLCQHHKTCKTCPALPYHCGKWAWSIEQWLSDEICKEDVVHWLKKEIQKLETKD